MRVRSYVRVLGVYVLGLGEGCLTVVLRAVRVRKCGSGGGVCLCLCVSASSSLLLDGEVDASVRKATEIDTVAVCICQR